MLEKRAKPLGFGWQINAERVGIMHRSFLLTIILAIMFATGSANAADDKTPFHVLVMAETGGVHGPFVEAAKAWLADQAAKDNFTVDYIEDAKKIDDEFLSHYQLFLQLNYPPYAWSDSAKDAFKKYMIEGKGGWVGLHHASLIGEFDGYHPWPWFQEFMGGITWKDYIPKFASGQVNVEDKNHPVMKGVPASFTIKKEEWYTYDKSPRPNVHVIASVDESTYVPDGKVKMGDHPIIWTNDKIKARNVYIFMGHSKVLFDDDAYKLVLKNAILWAARRN
jgi:type 1 glutamine amidotransferase